MECESLRTRAVSKRGPRVSGQHRRHPGVALAHSALVGGPLANSLKVCPDMGER